MFERPAIPLVILRIPVYPVNLKINSNPIFIRLEAKDIKDSKKTIAIKTMVFKIYEFITQKGFFTETVSN